MAQTKTSVKVNYIFKQIRVTREYESKTRLNVCQRKQLYNLLHSGLILSWLKELFCKGTVGQWLKMTGEQNRFNNHSSKCDAENVNLKDSRHLVSIRTSKHSTSRYITLTD